MTTHDHATTDPLDGVIVQTPEGNELRHRHCVNDGEDIINDRPTPQTLGGHLLINRCRRCNEQVQFLGSAR